MRSKREYARALTAACLVMASMVWTVGRGYSTAKAAIPSPPVFFNDLSADRTIEPDHFGGIGQSTDDPWTYSKYVQGLHWSSWGGVQATATGSVWLSVPSSSETSPVVVTLGGLQTCGGQLIYTSYSLQLRAAATAPSGWPRGETGRFPCTINAGGYYPSDRLAREETDEGQCPLDGIANEFDGNTVRWRPGLPRGALGSYLCRPRWSSWGKSIAVGEAVFRDGLRQWGARITLSGLAFCTRDGVSRDGRFAASPQLGVSYTRLTMTLYGRGEPEPSRPPFGVSATDLTRLLGAARRPHVKRATYRQEAPGAEGCLTQPS